MASETTQKVLFVVALGGAVAAMTYCKRGARGTSPQNIAKTHAPIASATAAAPVTGSPIDRVVDFEIPSKGCSRNQFGEALAAAGNSLLVGAPSRDYAIDHDDDVPAACLYRREGESWSLAQKLTADEPKKSEGYARAVALGETFAVVGAAGHENGDGPTHDYSRSGKASLRALLEEPSGAAEVLDEYGAAVASDERIVIVGAHLRHNPACDGCGGAFVFRRDRPKAKPILIEGHEPHENLGTAAAISGDLVVLGGAAYYSNGKLPGAAVVLRFDGGEFRAICRLRGTMPAEEYGASVAVDGNIVVVGARGGSGHNARFTVHEIVDDACVPRGEFSSAGASVAIAGKWIVAGQPWFDGGAKASGRVGLFHISADGSIEHRAWLLPKRTIERGWFGAAVALTTEYVFAGAPGMRRDGSAFVAGSRL